MSNEKISFSESPVFTASLLLSIALISFLAYNNVLNYYFTGIDTMSIIDAGRIVSFDDVATIFNNTLAFGTPMADKVQKCYRPIPALSFSLDYAIWKMNPFGYNLTNLILHILVSMLVFFFISLLTKGKHITAWLSAILFTLHPLMAESIPATVRRFDTMVALFVILSLIMFLKHFETLSVKKTYIFFSILFYTLALLTKEVAVILPFIIFISYIVLHPYESRLSKESLLNALKGSLPYFILTAVYIIWRSHVLGGIGGYVSKIPGPAAAAQVFIKIGTDYFISLFYPVDFLRIGSLFTPYPSPVKHAFFLILLTALFVSVAVFRIKLKKLIYNDRRMAINVLKSLLAALFAISLIGILSYPLIASYINVMIQRAYDGVGPQFLVNEMNSRDFYSVESYIYKTRDIILRTSFLFLMLTSTGLLVTYDTEKIKRFPSASFNLRITLFLLCWMLLPLGLYLLTSVSGRYYLYIAVIPFTSILALIIVEGFHYTLRKATKGSSLISLLFNNWTIPGFALAVLMSVSFVFYSPLFNDYGEWKDSGVITQTFLKKLSQALPGLPDDAVLHIYNYPDRISSYKNIIPHAEEVVYMNDYNIESWLRMNFPDSKIKIMIESRKELAYYPHDLKLEISNATGNDVNVAIKYY